MQIKVTDQFTGHYGIYELDNLARDLSNINTTEEEDSLYLEIEDAFRENDWSKVAEISAQLKMDFEII